jgi:carbonic anhydrase/acetyltransferase-like protein (isoleucine patch superfamily)
MKSIIPFLGAAPEIAAGTFVDPTSVIIGRVTLGKGAGVFPMCVLRGDGNPIVVEEEAVILDKVLIEASRPVTVGRRALISHGAILHGCRVAEGALVGIGAIVLDGAVVGKNAMVGAGSLVPPGMTVPEGSLVLGIPAKVVRKLSPEEVRRIDAQVDEALGKAAVYRKMQ